MRCHRHDGRLLHEQSGCHSVTYVSLLLDMYQNRPIIKSIFATSDSAGKILSTTIQAKGICEKSDPKHKSNHALCLNVKS